MPLKDLEARRAYVKAKYAANREERLAKAAAYYRENADRIKAKALAWHHANRELAHDRSKAWRLKNSAHLRQSKKQYAVANKQKIREQQLRWARSPKGRAKSRECLKRWKQSHPDRMKQHSLAYARRNPEKLAAQCNKRRAMKLGAAVGDRSAYVAFVKRVKSPHPMSCYWCNKPVPQRRRHIDHIIPLARGGADDVHNLCCSCATCNRKKNAKLPHEFCGQHVLPFGAAA